MQESQQNDTAFIDSWAGIALMYSLVLNFLLIFKII